MDYLTYCMGELKENCYCIYENEECILIDPGSDNEKDIEKIKELIGKKKLLAILYTHNHYDHIRGGHFFNVPQYMHEEDIKTMKSFNKKYGITGIQYPHVEAMQEEFQFGKIKGKVVHTPGHSKGSVCLDFEKFLCTGDTIFYQAHGRTDIPFANEKIIFESLKKILTYPDETILLPGHGKETILAQEKMWMEVLTI